MVRDIDRWADAPLAALVLLLVGAFMTSIYPILYSAVRNALPPARQSTMVGVIVVILALNGATGSFVACQVLALFGPAHAFYPLLVPIVAPLGAIVVLRALRHGPEASGPGGPRREARIPAGRCCCRWDAPAWICMPP